MSTQVMPGVIASEAMTLGAAQVEEELRQVIELLTALHPSVIVEIGCYQGGTLYAWRQVCERVYGITLLQDDKYDGGRSQRLLVHGATVRYGDSHDPVTLEWLKSELNGDPVDVLVIDADHRYDAVKQDYLMYTPLVRPGGLVLIHDVLLRYPEFPDQDFQVWKFWEDLQASHGDTWVIGTQVGWGIARMGNSE